MSPHEDPDSHYRYDYDDNGRLTLADNTGTPGVPDIALTYDYDRADHLTQVTDLLGGVEAFTYDDLNRVASITQSGTGVMDKRVELSYDAGSQIEIIQRFNRAESGTSLVTNRYEFDDKGRLSHLTHGSVACYKLD